jgi:hypothetical protein
VSIKGVLVEAGRVVLLENDRDGRLEPGEAPETCLVREFEELGAVVEVARIISAQRFCSTGHRQQFWIAARRWTMRAIEAGLLSVDCLKASHASVHAA